MQNIWKKSGRKQNNFLLSFSLASPELPNAPSEASRTEKIRSSLVRSESSQRLSMICKTENQKLCDHWSMSVIAIFRQLPLLTQLSKEKPEPLG
jgi:hypothetical protein